MAHHQVKNLSSSLIIINKDFPEAKMIKNLSAMYETGVQSLDWEVPLEKGMAIHSSILAWRILWTEKAGELVRGVAKSQTQLSG